MTLTMVLIELFGSTTMDVDIFLQFSSIFDVPVHVTDAVRSSSRLINDLSVDFIALFQSGVLPHVGARR